MQVRYRDGWGKQTTYYAAQDGRLAAEFDERTARSHAERIVRNGAVQAEVCREGRTVARCYRSASGEAVWEKL